jgi:Bbp16-like protein
MIHKISTQLAIQDDSASGAGLGAQSKAAAAYNLASVDLTKYEGGFAYLVSAGAISGGATVDFKLQDSDDNASFADVASASITQLVASGKAILDSRVRAVRRYVRGVLTVGTAATAVEVTFIAQPRSI